MYSKEVSFQSPAKTYAREEGKKMLEEMGLEER
jgi:hypothetical protein